MRSTPGMTAGDVHPSEGAPSACWAIPSRVDVTLSLLSAGPSDATALGQAKRTSFLQTYASFVWEGRGGDVA